MQSSYLPWKGLFDIINDVDIFVFYDTVQYSKRGWTNRNRIKSPLGSRWITVPVSGSTKNSIQDTNISGNDWSESHYSAIRQSYYKSNYWDDVEEIISTIRKNEFNTISELNQHMIRKICTYLGIETKIICSSQIPQTGSKTERLISIINQIGAESYLSGPAAKSYINNEFRDAGIELCWKSYLGYPEYQQQHGEFDHHVSVIDLISCKGPESAEFIFGWRENSNMESFTIDY